jgi:HEAT repeat protein
LRGESIMRWHGIFLALHLLLAACWMPALAQVGDKKKDDTKKEPEKITAETKIGGKNLAEWTDLIKGKDRSETEIALRSILMYPPDVAVAAVPAMLAELKKHDNTSTGIDMSVRVNVAAALGPILAGTKNHKDPKDSGRDLAKEAVERLQKMLTDKQVMVRYRAAQALGVMGPLAKKAIPALCKLAGDAETWENRYQAVLALGPVSWDEKNGPPDETISTLLGALSANYEPAARVRLAALDALANLKVGQFAKEKFLKRLEAVAAEDINPLCRLRAHLYLWPVLAAKDHKRHLDALEKLLSNPDPDVRLELIHGVAALAAPDKDKKGEPQKILMALIYKALEDKVPVVRIEAMQVLGHLKMGDFDRGEYLTHLHQIGTTDPELLVRLTAYSWIFPIIKKPDEKDKYGKGLGALVNKGEPPFRVEVCKLIGEIGEDAGATVPDLIKGLSDPDPQVQHWCIYALGNLEKAGRPALPALEKILMTSGVSADIRETAQDAINIITGKEKLGKHQQKKAEDKK